MPAIIKVLLDFIDANKHSTTSVTKQRAEVIKVIIYFFLNYYIDFTLFNIGNRRLDFLSEFI